MNVPWFIFDLTNKQLITSNTVPQGDIGDTKNVIFAETPILGNNYAPVSSGANGNRKVSLQIPIINRDFEGNIGLVKQFELLRNKSRGFLGLKRKNQWANNPKILYYWGIGDIPLEWYVTKCDFQHRADMVNLLGLPQYTMLSLELTLDESSVLYKVEEVYRDITAVTGGVTTMLQGVRGWI